MYPRKQSISQVQQQATTPGERTHAFSSSSQLSSFVSPSQVGDSDTIIAEIIKSPRSAIASELHKRDSGIAALKRNVQHLTRKTKESETEMNALQTSISSLESLNETLRIRLSSDTQSNGAASLATRKKSMFASVSRRKASFVDKSVRSLNQISSEEHDKALSTIESLERQVEDQATQMKLSASNNKRIREQLMEEVGKLKAREGREKEVRRNMKRRAAGPNRGQRTPC